MVTEGEMASASTHPVDAYRVQRRTVRILVAAQILGGLGVGSGIAVGSLLVEQLSGSATLAGLALTASVLGGALAAVPLARLSQSRGRRWGVGMGYATGAVGGLLVVVAADAGAVLFEGPQGSRTGTTMIPSVSKGA
jgi:MFS family permease